MQIPKNALHNFYLKINNYNSELVCQTCSKNMKTAKIPKFTRFNLAPRTNNPKKSIRRGNEHDFAPHFFENKKKHVSV